MPISSRLLRAMILGVVVITTAATLGCAQGSTQDNGMALFRVGSETSSDKVLQATDGGDYIITGAVGERFSVWRSSDTTSPVVEVLFPETIGGVTVFHGVPLLVDSSTELTIDTVNASPDELVALLETAVSDTLRAECSAVPDPPLMRARTLEITSGADVRGVAGGMPWPGSPPENWCDEILKRRGKYWLDFKGGSADILGVLTSAESKGGFGATGEVAIPDCIAGCIIYHQIAVSLNADQFERGQTENHMVLRLKDGVVTLDE